MNWYRGLLVVGSGLVVLGLVALFVPGALALSAGQAALTVVAVLAFFQAGRVLNQRRKNGLDTAQVPEVEELRTATPPGTELQEATRPFWKKPTEFYRLSSREGIRAAAVAVLTRYENLTSDEAHSRLNDGTWTDDTAAGQYLKETENGHDTAARLRAVVTNGSGQEHGVRESIESIASIAGLGDDETEATSAQDSDTETEETDYGTAARVRGDAGTQTRRETGYWRGVSAAVLLSIGMGLVFREPGLVLLGVVGLGYGAYARSHAITPALLSIERAVSTTDPSPGDDIEVTVTLTNDGSQTLPDVRFVDGVPTTLAVTDGSPRVGTVLRPGETVVVTYTVTARRGTHTFDPAQALVRNLPATLEYEQTLAPDPQTEITCVPDLEALPVPMPLRSTAANYTGTQATASSGHGTEFYATRMYQHGDDISRIDWNRRAKTGELSTILFRKEQAATVVLLVDNEPDAYVAPEQHTEHAVDRAVDAAGRLFTTITDDGHFVGISSLAETDCWLQPSRGSSHRSRARTLLATHPALQSRRSVGQGNPTRVREKLKRRLPPNAQVIVLSPVCRQSIVRFIRELDATDHPVTVLSPDPTADWTPSQQLARVGRRVNITDLRQDGIPVIDWAWEESLATALARFAEQQEVTV